MSNTDPPPQSPVPPEGTPPPVAVVQKPQPPWMRYLYGIIAVVAVIVGAAKIYDFFVLPACDSDRVVETLTSLFEKTGAKVKSISDMKATGDSSSPRMCAAHVDAGDEQANFEYQVTWSGWDAMVKIGKVDTGNSSTTGGQTDAPAPPAPAAEPAPAATTAPAN
ncbi:MAG TPA: hypothetical protein VFB16_09585 [Bauldia sp.]|nr:hypothetical protein [Bauldia sp.]